MRIEERLSKKVSFFESYLTDDTKISKYETRYLDWCKMCNQFGIDHHLLDVAFHSFCQGRGAAFSRKYLRRFARRVVNGGL